MQSRLQIPTDREATIAHDAGAPEKQSGQVLAGFEVNNESPWNNVALNHHLPAGEVSFPECRVRRLLEMKLLHHWVVSTSLTILSPGEPERRNLWIVELPRSVVPTKDRFWDRPAINTLCRLALTSDALMHALLAFTASHLKHSDPSDTEAASAHEQYLSMTIREHNEDVANFTRSNIDAACMTATFIRLIACSKEQVRPRRPYSPPMQWLKMVRSACQVYSVALGLVREDHSSLAFRFIDRFQDAINPEILQTQANFPPRLTHLLHRTDAHLLVEPWSVRIEHAYASTLNIIGHILDDLITQREAKPDDTCRRLILFPHFLNQYFVDLVDAQQPRALVILGHYFALLKRCSHLWWIGNSGEKELEGLTSVLPEDWRYSLLRSLEEMEGRLPDAAIAEVL